MPARSVMDYVSLRRLPPCRPMLNSGRPGRPSLTCRASVRLRALATGPQLGNARAFQWEAPNEGDFRETRTLRRRTCKQEFLLP